jgi:hypothetical protein
MTFEEMNEHYGDEGTRMVVALDKRVGARRPPGAKPAGLDGRSPVKGLSGWEIGGRFAADDHDRLWTYVIL